MSAPKVVIIGGGFAGLEVARGLKGTQATITLIDKRNYHLFQPLLYQVATAGLSSTQVTAPIRSLVKNVKNCEVVLGEVKKVDRAAKRLYADDRVFDYDYLVVATGAETNYFGNNWENVAPSLKNIGDATKIRRSILMSFEKAEACADASDRAKYLNFVIVGGGPTGVELAGAIAELAHMTLAKDFRHIDTKETQVHLIEAGDRLLAAFPEELSEAAEKKLKRMGVHIGLAERASEITPEKVVTNKRTIPTTTVIWAAGVKATPAGEWLSTATDRRGRVLVNEYLNLQDDPCVFVIGDVAAAKDIRTGEDLPGMAPVAIQEGQYVAHALKRRMRNKHPSPFVFFDKGILATIGRTYAVAKIGPFKFRGLVAWLLWAFVHILYLIGFRNRLFVILDWIWAYITYQRSNRIIIEEI